MSDCKVIVIPTYNRLSALERCVNSLAWCGERDDVRVVVVDSGSTDGTREYLSSAPVWVVQVQGHSDMWWTAAVEEGTRVADDLGATYVTTLNDDCVLADNDYEALLTAVSAEPGCCVCPKVVFMGTGEIMSVGGVIDWTGQLVLPHFGEPDRDGLGVATPDWCGGIGFTYPIEAWRMVGGYSSARYPHYYGDADFVLRLKKSGWAIRYCPEARVANDKSTTSAGVPRTGARMADLILALTNRRSWANIPDAHRFYFEHAGVRAPLALGAVYIPFILAGLKRIMLSAFRGLTRG